MSARKWTTEENTFLMANAYKKTWAAIGQKLDRSPKACEAHFNKIRQLREKMGTWKGV